MNYEKSRNLRPPAPFFIEKWTFEKKCGLNQPPPPHSIRVQVTRIFYCKITLEFVFLCLGLTLGLERLPARPKIVF